MSEKSPEWLCLVREKVETLRYDVVQIVVHDSRVTQIERTEKLELRPVKSVVFMTDHQTNWRKPSANRAFYQTTGERSPIRLSR